jgi:hypothetical protein
MILLGEDRSASKALHGVGSTAEKSGAASSSVVTLWPESSILANERWHQQTVVRGW